MLLVDVISALRRGLVADPKRIQNESAESGDILVVSRHQCESMGCGGGREQAVDDRYRPGCAHAPPPIGDRIVDGEDSGTESRRYLS
jgi:hypothetical protein